MMRNLSSDLKLGFVALLLTFAVAFVMLYIWFVGHDLSRTFIGEAQKISATLPILAVTEGQVAEWTNELRKTESFKGEMDSHLAEQINKIRLGEYTADQLNEHLASCKKFCGPLLGKIFEANMREIARLPHAMVFFDLDKHQVAPKYQREVAEFARRNSSQTFHLVGRASLIGSHVYNKDLSARRVRQVEAILKRCALPEQQVKSSWLGYEAPQLTREIADTYEIDPTEYKEDLFALNQSVVLFTSTPHQYFPGVVNTMKKAMEQQGTPVSKQDQKNRQPTKVSVTQAALSR
jgi:outer membrane protein OmpA-like peptidoglycan-associated protein